MDHITEITRFERVAGKGALFAKADRDTGEITRITGEWVTPEGVTIYLEGTPIENAGLSLAGRVQGHDRIPVQGLLTPQTYGEKNYKAGYIKVGKKEYKVNSCAKRDRNGQPFRFVWFHRNEVRAEF